MPAIFENLDELLKKIADINECSKTLITFASAVGVLVVFFYSIYIAYKLAQLLRLYVFSQYCCKVNFVQKYGRWAVISGATDGIGLAMAKELAQRGMSILVISRNEDKLARTKTLLEQEPNVGEVETIKIDMSDSSIENFEKIRLLIDPENRDIGLLINNAGTFPDKYRRFNRFDIDEHLKLVNLNILGTVHLIRMIMPGMLERGRGLVVNVSSVLGSIPGPYLGAYAPTKAFVNSFTNQLQMEYSSHPIDIVLLEPGPVATKLLRATSKISDPSFLTPSPEEYAKTSINALSTRIDRYTGNLMHQFLKNQSIFLQKLSLLSATMKLAGYMNGKNYEVSPLPKRKRVVVVSAQEEETPAGPVSGNQVNMNIPAGDQAAQ